MHKHLPVASPQLRPCHLLQAAPSQTRSSLLSFLGTPLPTRARLLTATRPSLCLLSPGPVRPFAGGSTAAICRKPWGKPASSLSALKPALSSRWPHAHLDGPVRAALLPRTQEGVLPSPALPPPSNGFKPQPKPPGSKQSLLGLLVSEPLALCCSSSCSETGGSPVTGSAP